MEPLLASTDASINNNNIDAIIRTSSNAGISNTDANKSDISYEEEQEEEQKNGTYFNDDDNHSSLLLTATGTNDSVFDDLEFLHDFLEAESRRAWFELNCFKCNFKNIFILFILLLCIFIMVYIIYHFEQDYIDNNWPHLLQLSSIPIICIIFTYCHIALALWMTFWPTEFFGIYQYKSGPFAGYGIGWQGIVPMKAVEMAQIAVDLMVPDVVRMEDVVAKIDPQQVTKIVEPALLEILKIIIPRVAAKQAPVGWALLPQQMKDKMITVAIEDSHISVQNMISDINENIEEMFDLGEFIGNAFRTDKELLSRIFLKCGCKELIFIRNFGGLLGLVFGLAQMFANIYFHESYWFNKLMLPVSGFVLGWITNWIALKLIFRPIEPITIPLCGNKKIVIQGLFLKRQREVSVEFASFITKRILRAEYLLPALYAGPSSDKLFVKITKHLQDAVDRFAGYEKFKPLIEFALGSERFKQAKEEVIDGLFNCLELKCAKQINAVQKKLEEYTDEAMDIERLLRTKMAELTSHEFEGVLHPVFEQDEIKLIMIGAMLGLMVGLFQVYVIGN